MKNPYIQRTSNKIENYYRQTDPEQNKNKIHHQQRNTQLPKPKMKKWTHKHEKNQHPITLQTPKNLKKNKLKFNT